MVRNVQSLKLSKDHLMVSRPGQIARLLSDQSALGLFKPPHLCPVAQTAWLAYMMLSYPRAAYEPTSSEVAWP